MTDFEWAGNFEVSQRSYSYLNFVTQRFISLFFIFLFHYIVSTL